jgi:hypothetical protein
MKFFTIFLAILFIKAVYPQGEYLERGHNGFGIGVSAAFSQKAYGLSAAAGVSIVSTFDFGLSYAFIFAKEIQDNIESISRAISPYLNIHIIKQTETLPLSLSAIAHYQKHTFNFTNQDQSASLDYWTYGGSIFHSFKVSEQYFIQPFITYTFTHPVDKDYFSAVQKFETTSFAVSIVSKKGKKRFIIQPSIAFSNDETIYSVGFEFVSIFSSN